MEELKLPEPCNLGQSLVGGVPKPWEPLYTADQVREYARAYLIAHGGDPEQVLGETYSIDIEWAIRVASLWRVGKMIGANEDEVRNALLAEVERLRATSP